MSNPVLIRNNVLAGRIVFVNGTDRSGKMETANLVATFDNVEKHRMDNVFELVPKLWELGKISEDAAISFLRTEADIHLYENMLGRNLNIRLEDMTSVYRYPDPGKYFVRLGMVEGDEAVARVKREKPVFQNTTHNSIGSLELFVKAFDDVRIVHCVRNPVDVVCDLFERGFGHRIGSDPREFQLTFDYDGVPVPLYAWEYRDEYVGLNDVERIVCTLESSLKKDIVSFNNFSKPDDTPDETPAPKPRPNCSPKLGGLSIIPR